MSGKSLTVCWILFVSIFAAACGGSEASNAAKAPAGGGANAVTIQMFRYEPARIEVVAGTAVVWTNRDEILHTATSGTPSTPTGLFDGAMDANGKSFSYIFNEPGTYQFFCSRHNFMVGEVQVTPK